MFFFCVLSLDRLAIVPLCQPTFIILDISRVVSRCVLWSIAKRHDFMFHLSIYLFHFTTSSRFGVKSVRFLGWQLLVWLPKRSRLSRFAIAFRELSHCTGRPELMKLMLPCSFLVLLSMATCLHPAAVALSSSSCFCASRRSDRGRCLL